MRPWVVPGYVEDRVLGNGASGRVVAAVHGASGRPVAIKYLAARLLRDPGFLAGFRAEAEQLKSLDVPEVVRIYDYVEAPGRGAAIVMELVNGVSLYQMIKHQGPAGPEAALTVLKGSLLGLASAHALGIVHRDYKPENVLVDDEGTSKLVDFGIAVKAGRRAPAAGTPLYMAPEQWAGAPPTAESDIYAATAVFFECLTGEPPFSGGMAQLARQHETAAVPVDQVDEPLRGLIARGMAKDPWDRPDNASELLRELEYRAAASYGPFWQERGRSQLRERAAALLSGVRAGGGSGQALATTVPGGTRRRRKIILAAAALAAIAVLAGAGTVFALQGTGSGSPAPGPAGSTSSAGPPTSPVSSQPPATTGTPSPRPGTSSPATGTPSASVVPPASETPPTTIPATGKPLTTRPAPPAHPSTRPPTTAGTTPGVPPPKSTPPPTSAPATTPPPTSVPGGTPSSGPASSPPAIP